jgi:cell division protein FtsB
MMVLRQERRGHMLNMHKVVTLVACLVIGYLIWSIIAALFYLGKAERTATQTFAELQTVSAQTLSKQKALEYHTTKSYVEKVAREDMLMSKKGDTVILFPVDQPAPAAPAVEETGLPKVLSKLIEWVKGWF